MTRVLTPLLAFLLLSSGFVRAEPDSLDGVAPPEDALVTPPDPRELGEGWFEQLQGFDALEAYEARAGRGVVQFVVARRWRDGRAQILVDVVSPRSYTKWAFLFLQNRERSDDFFVYVPGLRRVLRLPAVQLEGSIMAVLGRHATLADLRPILPGELEYELRPDSEIDGEPCWTVEARPADRWLGFERMELAISKRTGVALRTAMHKGSEVRRILVSPKDVRIYEGRYLPIRRRLEVTPAGVTVEVFLRNLMIDPPLPDQLFSKQSLLTQRFPKF